MLSSARVSDKNKQDKTKQKRSTTEIIAGFAAGVPRYARLTDSDTIPHEKKEIITVDKASIIVAPTAATSMAPTAALPPIVANKKRDKKHPRAFIFSPHHIGRAASTLTIHSWQCLTPTREFEIDSAINQLAFKKRFNSAIAEAKAAEVEAKTEEFHLSAAPRIAPPAKKRS